MPGGWTSFFLYGGFLACTGIPLSDFYPFGAHEKDFTLDQLWMAIILLCWIKNFLSLMKGTASFM